MNLKTPKVSIIVRTYNEEKWIAHCLSSIFTQDFDSFEVILVDNNSTDHTVEVAKRYPISSIVKIDKFFPGKAINDGIRVSIGSYIVCISAHCIPKNSQWLKNLFNNFVDNKKIAGVYGRQIPLSFTSDADKRDLVIAFGQDKKTQIKDYFFHNANSMLPRAIWNKFPFDESVTNIEDRIWGKLVIEAGYEIIYEPSASVYHYHGLHHHGNSSNRAKGIAKILDKLDEENSGDLPESLKPENIGVASILLVNEHMDEKSIEFKLLQRVVNELKLVSYVDQIYIASDDESIAQLTGTQWIDRKKPIFNTNDINIERLLSLSLMEIESRDFFPEVVLYVNHHYPFRPKNLFSDLIIELQYMGLSSVFPCFQDYGHYWQKQTNSEFIQIDSSMESRSNREPIMRALYGLGCATSSVEIRKGNITGNDVGIVSIDNYQFTLNSREIGSKEIIKRLLDY
jgi:glycosyltransferase involved in cell wall biosynthesis